MIEKNLKISSLLDFYGDFLTVNQRQVLALYYNEDLSLSEIADNQGITRQGVRDAIKKAELQLLDMEEKLNLYRKFTSLQNNLLSIIKNASEIEDISTNKNIFNLAKIIKETAINLYEQ